jgi:hypothetical protein
MRVLMSFVITEPVERRVLTGPAWSSDHTAEVFELMRLEADLTKGTLPLTRFAEGLAAAKQKIEAEPWKSRPKVEQTLTSLATWATVARIKGATAIAWREDF